MDDYEKDDVLDEQLVKKIENAKASTYRQLYFKFLLNIKLKDHITYATKIYNILNNYACNLSGQGHDNHL